jgi:hypothetical protein
MLYYDDCYLFFFYLLIIIENKNNREREKIFALFLDERDWFESNTRANMNVIGRN